MTAQRTEIGDVLRIETTIRNISGANADPGTLTFTMNPPNATPIAYIYQTHPQIVRSGLGVYYVDYEITAAGTYSLSWESDGANAAYAESSFVAQPRRVVAATP